MSLQDYLTMLAQQNDIIFRLILWCPTATTVQMKLSETKSYTLSKNGNLFYITQAIIDDIFADPTPSSSSTILIDNVVVYQIIFS